MVLSKKINEDKIFDGWNGVKKRLNKKKGLPRFKRWEVWWCGVGKNIGVEVYGKNENFSRPMLVFFKFSNKGFLGICMTSKNHKGKWYVECTIKGRKSRVNMGQLRTTSANRLYRKIGRLGDDDVRAVKRRFREIYMPGVLTKLRATLKKILGW